MRNGNIFTTECQTIVNTINCVGVMGAGIAYEFRLRHPEMCETYKKFCDQKLIDVGKLWIYKTSNLPTKTYSYILNFPTKKHWKYPSKIEYLEKGLKKFVETYQEKNISSIAFPLLGASKGNLDKGEVLDIMKKYLSNLNIEIEIWEFDPSAKDDVFENFKDKFLQSNDEALKQKSKLRIDFIRKIKEALKTETINSMSGLLQVKGIGEVTLEKSFNFIQKLNHE